jgi:hypothetical protein
MTGYQCDGGEREVHDGVQHWEEAVRIRKWIHVGLVKFHTSAPEFLIAAAGYHSAFRVLPECAVDVMKGADDFLAEGNAEPILRSFQQSDDEDTALTVYREMLKG